MTDLAPETSVLVDALRSAVSGQAMPVHVGQLRQQVDAALGPEQARLLRREVHQVMVAAEEHLPSRLMQVRPLTALSLARLSSELATTRSWAPATAERTTRIWAAALGFEHLAEVQWPAPPTPAQRPSASIDSLELGVTAAPPQAQRPTVGAEWPKPSKRLAKNHSVSSAGEVPVGISQAYAGMPFAVFAGLLLAITVILVVAFLILPTTIGFLAPFLGFGAATALARVAGQGALVATAAGVEFVPYKGVLGSPASHPSRVGSWTEVSVEVGTVSTVTVQGQRIQVGPLGRAFAGAAATRAQGLR